MYYIAPPFSSLKFAIGVAAVLIVVLIILMYVVRYVKDRKTWNKGICRESKQPWILFNSDLHGNRGYHDCSGNYIWIKTFADRTWRKTKP